MTEAEVHANPQRISALADELHLFVTNLRREMDRTKDGLGKLGATWRDNEYMKFKQAFDRVSEELKVIDQEVSRREPELKEDARLLLDYLNKGQ